MNKQVTIYSTPTCHYCHAAKEFFKENNIEYTDRDVTQDTKAREEMIEKSGQLGVPVIVVDDKILVGFDKNALSELLEIKQTD